MKKLPLIKLFLVLGLFILTPVSSSLAGCPHGAKGDGASCGAMPEGKACCAAVKEGKPCTCKMKGDHHGHMHGHGKTGMGDDAYHGSFLLDHAKELNLTEDQVSKLKKLQEEASAKSTKAEEQMEKAWSELGELSHEKDVNRRKIGNKAEEIGELKGEMLKARIMAKLDAKEILTEEQKTKLGEMMKVAPPKKGRKKK